MGIIDLSWIPYHGCHATPDTFLFPQKVSDVYHEAGGDQHAELKIILALRDPISRELSLSNHMASVYNATQSNNTRLSRLSSKNGSTLSFDDYVTNILEPDYVEADGLKMGFYANNLNEWRKHFEKALCEITDLDFEL